MSPAPISTTTSPGRATRAACADASARSRITCPAWPPAACCACHRKTHRYGRGGTPLCQWCMAAAQAKWGPNVRYTSTRGT